MSDFDRRNFFYFAVAACLPACSKPARILRVATQKGQFDLLMKMTKNISDKYTVEYSYFSSGNTIVEALNSKAIDLCLLSEVPLVFGAIRDPDLRSVAVQVSDVSSQVCLVPQHSAIRRPADLKGKRIGYVRGTTSHYFLLRLLEEAGLDMSQVYPISLSTRDGLSAFASNSLDAWFIFGVSGFLARENYGARILASGVGRLSGNFLWTTRDECLKEPQVKANISDYLLRIRAGWSWAEQHPDKWATAVAEETGVSFAHLMRQHYERNQSTALIAVNSEAIRAQQQVADSFAKAKIIPRTINVSKFWSHALSPSL